MGSIAAVLGAVLGLGAWALLMRVFAAVCRGVGDFLLCAGMGGPSLFDLLTLPVAVIGAGYMGWTMATENRP